MADRPHPIPNVVSADFAAAAKAKDELPPPTTLEVAFAGRSNVGKSSLINSLVARKKLVRTSSTPGCTRAIGFFPAKLENDAELVLVDLPGYGYAKRSKAEREVWADLIEEYILGRPTLRAVVVIVDVRRGLEAEERDLFELIASPARVSRPPLVAILVATKLDKLPASKRKPRLAELSRSVKVPVIAYSAIDGTGRDQLWRRILKALDLLHRRAGSTPEFPEGQGEIETASFSSSSRPQSP